MRFSFQHVQSFLLTAIFSFTLPLLLIGSLLGSLTVVHWLPGLTAIGYQASNFVVNFLATFGDGHALNGSFVIAAAFGFVGGLFYACTPYHYHDSIGCP
ncbi:hypothetical protein VB712_04740 [Spirulina sp. CCNP1310]|uniref:hypothetical protein n=1 Tax=Spirulina sp. CCNP1310 TaxID=3110249 RepID=UPI002B218D9E|nr:hypothetical protein [Spirulina sp. CCNP1310]MEA5418523.1 hypothetical protein [Spirulina sp. CCNP1310]